MFDLDSILSQQMFDWITDRRVGEPDRVVTIAKKRKRRKRLPPRSRLHVIAADHPARRVTHGPGNPLAMSHRRDFLGRIVRVLTSGGADGVMASMDVIEELLLLGDVLRDHRGRAFFDDKLLIASINRGGLSGAPWELDDPVTGPDAETCEEYRLDGAKVLMRVLDDDERSLATLKMAAGVITRMNERGLRTFLEPLPMVRKEGKLVLDTRPAEIARLVGVASALGSSSRNLWLKLPYCSDFGMVARATTLPILLLGGESVGDPTKLLREVASALAAGANVRGAMAGRNVMYPGEGRDPLAAARAMHAIIHEGLGVEDAAALMEREG